jgi:hypothetical protein
MRIGYSCFTPVAQPGFPVAYGKTLPLLSSFVKIL